MLFPGKTTKNKINIITVNYAGRRADLDKWKYNAKFCNNICINNLRSVPFTVILYKITVNYIPDYRLLYMVML